MDRFQARLNAAHPQKGPLLSPSLSIEERGRGEERRQSRHPHLTSPRIFRRQSGPIHSLLCISSSPPLRPTRHVQLGTLGVGFAPSRLEAGPFCYTTRQGRRKQMKLLNCCTHRKESPSFLSRRRRPETALPFSHLTAATFGPFPLPTSPKSPAAFLPSLPPSLLPSAACPFPIPILLLLRSLMGLDDRSIYGPFRQSDWKTADTHHNTKTGRSDLLP